MIRPAGQRDAPAIMDIWNLVIATTTHNFTTTPKTLAGVETQIADHWADGHGIWVTEAAGAVAGFASYGQFRGGNGYARCMEHSVHLTEAARGKGLGRALMAVLEDHARQAGAHLMIAGISGENPGAQAFHAAIGYSHVARIPQAGWKWGRYLDLVLMQKILS
jgi:L-amino acid N-acyltransferase